MTKRKSIPKTVRDKVLVDAMHRCCLCPEHQEVVDLHHVVPISEDGLNTEENLMAVCPTCHAKIHRIRNRYTPEQLRMYKERWVQLCALGLPLDARIAQAFNITRPPTPIQTLATSPVSHSSSLLDFSQATTSSLKRDWEPYGSSGDTVSFRLENDSQLGQILVKSGRGFHAALRHPPAELESLRWPPYQYYEMVIKSSHLDLALHINVATGDEDRTLLYGLAQKCEPNPQLPKKEFQIPLDERTRDGNWHSVILELMRDAKEAGWPECWSVRWLALHGELRLFRVRGSDDLSELERFAIDPVHRKQPHVAGVKQERNVTGISSDLHRRIRQALLDCGPLQDDNQLRAVFAHPSLGPWRHSVPQASDPAARVDAVIAFLTDRRRADTGENALVLLLRTLSERVDPIDALYSRLVELAADLERVFGGGASCQSN